MQLTIQIPDRLTKQLDEHFQKMGFEIIDLDKALKYLLTSIMDVELLVGDVWEWTDEETLAKWGITRKSEV